MRWSSRWSQWRFCRSPPTRFVNYYRAFVWSVYEPPRKCRTRTTPCTCCPPSTSPRYLLCGKRDVDALSLSHTHTHTHTHTHSPSPSPTLPRTSQQIEGMDAQEFQPKQSLDSLPIDEWIAITDEEAFETTRKLLVNERLLCGTLQCDR